MINPLLIMLIFFLFSGDQPIDCTATVYNAVRSQCNENPLVTADGSIIDTIKLNRGELKWVAISRDLFEKLDVTYGDKIVVKCETKPSISGTYEIHDTMNKRHMNKIDILMPNHINTGKWSVRIIKKRV